MSHGPCGRGGAAPAGVAGPIVIPLWTTPVPAFLPQSGTITNVNLDLIYAIYRDPTGFYANVHTSTFPNGAMRGQLTP